MLPIYLIYAKYKYFRETKAGLKDSWYQDLFSDLQAKNSAGLFYSPLFLVRRFAMVSIIILLPFNYLLQIFTHILLSFTQFAFVTRNRPFEQISRNRQEILNECAVTFCAYILLFFTEYCTDYTLQRRLGYVLLGSIAISVFFNLILVLIINIRAIIRKCKRKTAKKRYRQAMQ